MNAKMIDIDETDKLYSDEYDEMLNECYEEVKIGCCSFDPSEILKKLDPIAYRCGFLDYFDGKEKYRCNECGEIYNTEEEAENCCNEEFDENFDD